MGVCIDGCTCTAETAGTIMVEGPGLPGPAWVPKDQVEDDSEVKRMGDSGRLVVTEWLADRKGWPCR